MLSPRMQVGVQKGLEKDWQFVDDLYDLLVSENPEEQKQGQLIIGVAFASLDDYLRGVMALRFPTDQPDGVKGRSVDIAQQTYKKQSLAEGIKEPVSQEHVRQIMRRGSQKMKRSIRLMMTGKTLR